MPGLPGSLSSSLSRSPVSCPRSGNGSSSARRGLPRAAIFTCLLGFVAIVLFEARRWGVHRGLPHGGRAGDLPGASIATAGAWHVGLARGQRGAGPGYPHSLEWHRPARSANAVVGATILALRLWVAIGILAVLKRPWDEWGPGGPDRTVSHSARPADVARRGPAGPPEAEPGTDTGPAAPQAPP